MQLIAKAVKSEEEQSMTKYVWGVTNEKVL